MVAKKLVPRVYYMVLGLICIIHHPLPLCSICCWWRSRHCHVGSVSILGNVPLSRAVVFEDGPTTIVPALPLVQRIASRQVYVSL